MMALRQEGDRFILEFLSKDVPNEFLISDTSLTRAYQLCKDVDMKDVPFVASPLELDGLVWTGDK
jgi:predicted nucleic acid-binding protein